MQRPPQLVDRLDQTVGAAVGDERERQKEFGHVRQARRDNGPCAHRLRQPAERHDHQRRQIIEWRDPQEPVAQERPARWRRPVLPQRDVDHDEAADREEGGDAGLAEPGREIGQVMGNRTAPDIALQQMLDDDARRRQSAQQLERRDLVAA
jgi:hypothetical protein